MPLSNSPAIVYCTLPARVCTCMHVVEEFRSSSANDTASSSPGSMNAAWLARGRAPYERQQENALPPGLLCILNCPATTTGSVLNLGASNCCFKLNAIQLIISQHIPGSLQTSFGFAFIFIIKCNFAQYLPAFGSLLAPHTSGPRDVPRVGL
jgi:hypothetical protein